MQTRDGVPGDAQVRDNELGIADLQEEISRQHACDGVQLAVQDQRLSGDIGAGDECLPVVITEHHYVRAEISAGERAA